MYAKMLQAVVLVIFSVISYYILPELKKFLQSVSTNKDGTVNKDAVFWTNLAIKVIENIKGDGNGHIKKELVIEYIKKLNVPLTEPEMSALIDLIVEYYNNQGWDKEILDVLPKGE